MVSFRKKKQPSKLQKLLCTGALSLFALSLPLRTVGDETYTTPSPTPSSYTQEIGVKNEETTPVLMYHKIDKKEDRFTVSPTRLWNHLLYLREHRYQLRTFKEHVQDPNQDPRTAVLTFDDSTEDHFRIIEGTLDPNCAVGILERFRRTYPDFPVTATFFVNTRMENGKPMFEQEGLERTKLEYLVREGYEVGSHGATHEDFSRLNAMQLSVNLKEFEISSFAYPYGSLPSPVKQQLINSRYAYTAHAWGGKSQGTRRRKVPRIEIGPDTDLSRYVTMNDPTPQEHVTYAKNTDKRNVYKGMENHESNGRSNPQLQTRTTHYNWQSDDCYRGQSGHQRGSCKTRRQKSYLQHWKERYRGRSTISSRELRGNQSTLPKRYARTESRPSSYHQLGKFFRNLFSKK
jgi:hypothetical protein